MSAEPATVLSRTGVAALAGHLPTPDGAAGDAVNALRFLAVDAVERADSGYPGTAQAKGATAFSASWSALLRCVGDKARDLEPAAP